MGLCEGYVVVWVVVSGCDAGFEWEVYEGVDCGDDGLGFWDCEGAGDEVVLHVDYDEGGDVVAGFDGYYWDFGGLWRCHVRGWKVRNWIDGVLPFDQLEECT